MTLAFGGPRENVYGSVKRLRWIERRLRPGDRVLEVGCGTGYMLTMPLIHAGHDVHGVDLDLASVKLGRRIAASFGLDSSRLHHEDLRQLAGPFHAVILSEVLEHQTDAQLRELLELVRNRLEPDGRLFVTVPNGYGLYELEALLWKRLGLGRLLERSGVAPRLLGLRHRLTGGYEDATYPSTLDQSAHLQRFTFHSIGRALEAAGFRVLEATGSVLVAGPLSNLIVTGHPRLMTLNGRLGSRFPRRAAGFYLLAERQ